MNITMMYKATFIIILSCLAFSTQSFAGPGKGAGGGGGGGMNNGAGNSSSGQQIRNKEHNRYGKQEGGNYQNQSNGQQNSDRNLQQNQERIQSPVTTQDQQQIETFKNEGGQVPQ